MDIRLTIKTGSAALAVTGVALLTGADAALAQSALVDFNSLLRQLDVDLLGLNLP